MRRHGLLTSWWNYDWMQHWDHWTSIVPHCTLVPVDSWCQFIRLWIYAIPVGSKNADLWQDWLLEPTLQSHPCSSVWMCLASLCNMLFPTCVLPSAGMRNLNLYSIWKLLLSHGQTAWKYFKRLKFIIGLVTPQNQSHAKVFGTCWYKCVIANLSNTNHRVHEVVAPWRVKKTP